MSFNLKIFDKIMAHSIGYERLKNGLTRKYAKSLTEIDKIMLGYFVAMIGATRSQQAKIIKEIEILKGEQYDLIEQQMFDEFEDIANRQANWLAALLGGALVENIVHKPTRFKLSDIRNIEVRGRKIAPIVQRLKQSEVERMITLAKTAVTDGLTLDAAKQSFKALTVKRTNGIRSIIHTIGAGVNDLANNRIFTANSHLIKGIKLAVVFDNRTTPICIDHSEANILYPVNNYPRPPFHWNCRTIPVPVVKSYADLGRDTQRRVPVNIRASMTGDTTFDKTYSQWLGRQSTAIQNDALGRSRAALFRTGKYKLSRFIDPTGKFYSVDDLFEKFKI